MVERGEGGERWGREEECGEEREKGKEGREKGREERKQR